MDDAASTTTWVEDEDDVDGNLDGIPLGDLDATQSRIRWWSRDDFADSGLLGARA
jgi:hypothetical protein